MAASSSYKNAINFKLIKGGILKRRPEGGVGGNPEPSDDYAQLMSDLGHYGFCYVKEALSPQQLAAARARLVDQVLASGALWRPLTSCGAPPTVRTRPPASGLPGWRSWTAASPAASSPTSAYGL